MSILKNDRIARAFARPARFTGVLAAIAIAGLYTAACDVHGPSDPGDLSSIVVSPNPQILAINGTQQFTAVGTDYSGAVVTFAPVWSIAAGGGAISATGLFTAGTAAGTFAATVTATSGSRSATATVLVTAGPLATIAVTPTPMSVGIGGTQQYVAVGKDASGNIVQFTPTWSVVAGGGAVSSTGLFTAGTVTGTFNNTIQASQGTISDKATVTVTAGPLASIVVAPTSSTLMVGLSQQFTAVGKDASDNIVVVSPTWSVENGGGTVDSAGLFTAGTTPGTYAGTVKATSGAISGTATVTVNEAAALATIQVTPASATVAIGGTQQFTAIGRDGNGDIFPISPVWTVENGGGAVGSAGLFTAGLVTGTFTNTVKATSGAISGTSSVTVTAVLPPPPPPIDLGAAGFNGIMAGQAVTCIIGGLINADVAISPGNTLTGFGPGECSISGVTHLADGVALQGQLDLTTAYNQLAAMPCAPANAIVADLGGTTKPAGVYCTASSIGVTGTLTLNGGGDPNATFVFQAGTSLITAGNIVLIGGAQAKNVYWLVGTSATLGTASQWQGNVLALTSITLVDNANLLGRALARNGSVSLGTNNVISLP